MKKITAILAMLGLAFGLASTVHAAGWGIDPNGAPASSTVSATGDAGWGIDPNG